MSTREHVQQLSGRILELICLLVAGLGLVVVGAVAGSVWLAGRVGSAPVAIGWSIAGVVVVGGLAALLLWAHFSGNGLAAHTEAPRLGESRTVVSKDGTELYVEVDGPADADVTVVFAHGWICATPVWAAQREAIKDQGVRAVFYDQRGHGRSGWTGMDEGDCGVRQLADDLEAVIAATAPTGRIVLVGHSMGGMTIMAFTERHLRLVEERVDAVMFLGTTAGPLSGSMTLGIPGFLKPLHPLVRRHAVSMITLLGFMPERMSRLLGVGPYLFFGNLLAVSSKSDLAKTVTAQGLWGTPLSVAGRTLKAVITHDERDAVPSLDPAKVVIVSGDADHLVPIEKQVELSRLIGDARHVIVPGMGHMIGQEAPDVVNEELIALLALARSGTHDGDADVAEVVVVESHPDESQIAAPTAAIA